VTLGVTPHFYKTSYANWQIIVSAMICLYIEKISLNNILSGSLKMLLYSGHKVEQVTEDICC